MKRSWDLAEKFETNNNIIFDLVLRIRPDIIYEYDLSIDLVKKSLIDNCIYMPHFHGKYFIVTQGIMDHFFLVTDT
jgi:hypothetical protein